MAASERNRPDRRTLPERAEDGILVILTTAMVVVTVSQIVMRNLLSTTLLWGDPLVRMLVLWTAFLGALVGVREDRHIRIDAVLRLLPDKQRCYVDIVVYLSCAAVCGLLAVIAVDFVRAEYAYAVRGALDLPDWVLQLVFPGAFGIMAWRFLRRSLAAMIRTRRAP